MTKEAEYEKIADFFGENHFLTRDGLIHEKTIISVVMDRTKKIMEGFCKEWPDEEVVITDMPSQPKPDGKITHRYVLAEWGYLDNGEYILVADTDNLTCLSDTQLIMIKREGMSAEAFKVSIDDFTDGHGYEFKPSISGNSDNQAELHELAKKVAQEAVLGKDSEKVIPLSPEELLEQFPLKLGL